MKEDGGITLGGDSGNAIGMTAGLYGSETRIRCYGNMYANAYNYNSQESKKKNITKFDENVLDILKNSELYSFNYKNEKDTDKKHIGFVIGDKGGNYKTPIEVISQNKEAINSYTMTSILWKAVQEQQEIIENLQKEIKNMKGESNE